MIIEASILDGEDRVLDVCRDLVILQRDSFFEGKLSDNRFAIVGIDTRDDAGTVSCERGDFAGRLRIVELIGRNDARQSTRRQGEQNDRRKPKTAQNVFALTRRRAHDRPRCI